ncbi:hypothetical protein BJ741DRAFT_624765 [Chytriomyces cf. hyalinus JEL632]|nr:hypothetical protein BJ741DRAFT_624765 [Chytriomyces cf. hyalinus JEL632]
MSDAITAPADGKWIRQAHKTLTTLSSKPVKTAGKVDKRTLATLSSLGLLDDATAPWGFSETARRAASFERRVALPVHGGVEVAWPHALDSDWECSAEKIAHTGMFYAPLSPDEPDHAACQYCQLGLAGWESNDDPIHEHRKRSPDCIMFLGPEVLTKFGLVSLPTARPASISIVIESNKFTAAKDDSDVEQSTTAAPSKARRINTNTTSVRSSVGSSLNETLGKDTKQNPPAVGTAKSNPVTENGAANDQENAPAEDEAPAKKKPAPRSKKAAAGDAVTTKTVKSRATKAAAAKSIENEESAKDASKATDTTATTVRPTRRRVLAPAAAAAAESAGSTSAAASKPAATRGRKKAVAVVIDDDEDQEQLSTNASLPSSATILLVVDVSEPFKLDSSTLAKNKTASKVNHVISESEIESDVPADSSEHQERDISIGRKMGKTALGVSEVEQRVTSLESPTKTELISAKESIQGASKTVAPKKVISTDRDMDRNNTTSMDTEPAFNDQSMPEFPTVDISSREKDGVSSNFEVNDEAMDNAKQTIPKNSPVKKGRKARILLSTTAKPAVQSTAAAPSKTEAKPVSRVAKKVATTISAATSANSASASVRAKRGTTQKTVRENPEIATQAIVEKPAAASTNISTSTDESMRKQPSKSLAAPLKRAANLMTAPSDAPVIEKPSKRQAVVGKSIQQLQSKSSVVPTSVTVPPEYPAMHKVVASFNPNTGLLKADFAQMMLDLEEELKTHDADELQESDEQAEVGEAAAGTTELKDMMRMKEPQNDESHGDIFDCYSEDGDDEQTVILRQRVSDPRNTEPAVCETTESQLLDAYFDTCQDPDEFSDDSQIVDPENLTQKCVVAYSRPEDFTSFCKLILEESPFEPVSSFASLSSEERQLTVGEFLKRKAAKEIERVRAGSRKMIEIVQEESLKARKVFEGLDV